MPELSTAEILSDAAAVWALIWPALAVMLLRIGDVALNVFRVVFVVQERRALAALTAGAETSLWLSAAGIVFSDLTLERSIGFVLGVALGTAIGVELASRLRLGMTTVRIYTAADSADSAQTGSEVATAIREAGYGATVFHGEGRSGAVAMVLSTVKRRDAEQVLAVARAVAPGSFAAIDNHLHPSPVPATSPAGRV